MAITGTGHADVEGGMPARIRDAAIVRFGREGFGVGLRAIAADADATAGSIIHHFGSKDGLRRACDDHVLEWLRVEKEKAVTDASATSLLARMAEVERFAPVVRYLLRSIQTGGALAAAMAEHMISDAEAYLAAGEAAGVIRASRDPAARTRFLAYQNLGSLVVWFTLHPDDGDDAEFAASLRAYVEMIAFPALELFSQGLFVDRAMLDEYLMYVPDPPSSSQSA
jgi:AcrR family transcriptional regulator